jgi:pimeloyl-ACP methyl ester carboxylesterase
MTEVASRLVEHDGLAFPLLEAGTGSPLLLLHGGGSRAAHFLPLMKALSGSFRVIAYDQRGFAGADVPAGVPIDHPHWASDVVGVLDALGIGRALVLGWSLGCSVAINAAAGWPERIAGLALVGAPDPGRPVAVEALRRRQAEYEALDEATLAERARADLAAQLAPAFRDDAALLDGLVADRMASRPELQARAIAAYASRPDLAAAAGRVQCPAFLFTGEHDRISPPEAAARMAEALRAGPPEVLPGVGHYAAAEDPALLARRTAARLLPLVPSLETA